MKENSKKRIKGALRIGLVALVSLILGVNVYTLIASRIAGNAVPMPFGVGAAVVLSGSMEPELSVGDLVIVAASNDYKVKDVIVFQEGRAGITHRIVSISGDEFVTRGDANNTEDSPISRAQIKGKVVLAIPFVGYAVDALKTPIGSLVILGLAIFLLEYSFLAKKQADEKTISSIKAEIEKLKQNND